MEITSENIIDTVKRILDENIYDIVDSGYDTISNKHISYIKFKYGNLFFCYYRVESDDSKQLNYLKLNMYYQILSNDDDEYIKNKLKESLLNDIENLNNNIRLTKLNEIKNKTL